MDIEISLQLVNHFLVKVAKSVRSDIFKNYPKYTSQIVIDLNINFKILI